MNYREKLKETKELDLEIDNWKQILDLCPIGSTEFGMVNGMVNQLVFDLLAELSFIHKQYDTAINISRINGSEKEITYLIDECNFRTGKAVTIFAGLLKVSNIGYYDMLNYYDTLLTEKKLKEGYFFDTQVLQTAFQFGRFNNIGDQIYNNPELNLRPINLPKEPEDDFFRGFRILNPALSKMLSIDLWKLSSSLVLATVELESKSPTIEIFHQQIMEAWLRFIKGLDMVGHNWFSFGRVFMVTNHLMNDNNGTDK